LSVYLRPVPGRGMVLLNSNKPSQIIRKTQEKQNRCHIAEKACILLFLSVSHRTLPVKCKFSERALTQKGAISIVLEYRDRVIQRHPCVRIYHPLIGPKAINFGGSGEPSHTVVPTYNI